MSSPFACCVIELMVPVVTVMPVVLADLAAPLAHDTAHVFVTQPPAHMVPLLFMATVVPATTLKGEPGTRSTGLAGRLIWGCGWRGLRMRRGAACGLLCDRAQRRAGGEWHDLFSA